MPGRNPDRSNSTPPTGATSRRRPPRGAFPIPRPLAVVDYSYNAQAVVDIAEQIIVAAETTNEANDKQQAVPMAQAALDNLNAAGIEQPKAADGTPTPIPNTADTGYFSKEAVEELEKMGIDPHIATGRQKHHEAPVPPEAAAPSAEAAAPSAEASAKEKMQRKLRTATGKALYAGASTSSSRYSA